MTRLSVIFRSKSFKRSDGYSLCLKVDREAAKSQLKKAMSKYFSSDVIGYVNIIEILQIRWCSL